MPQEDSYLAETKPIDHDNPVDDGIHECLKLGSRKNFITFAGAGSGKTYSLKKALGQLKSEYQKEFLRLGKQVAVVTFTNNAADEIEDRVEGDPIFAISTIHSFCWRTISGFNEDIREWYRTTIPHELNDLKEKERKGRPGKASDARKRSIVRLSKKLEWLDEPQTFVYDPNGVNSAQNALSHADVLNLFAHFLKTKPMMGEILANKYPFIFVDESQDTNKEVIDGLFTLQRAQANKIVIGLFGDTMQRIFGGGEPELGKSVPENWLGFDKQMNHRSARRIIGLGNAIRRDDDGRQQYAREGAEEGLVRFFLLPQGTPNKDEIEQDIRQRMAHLTDDPSWSAPKAKETGVLLLEHKMAFRRLGSDDLIDALSQSSRIKDRLFEGSNTELNFFANTVLPLFEAGQSGDEFEVMTILRKSKSVLLEEAVLKKDEDDPLRIARTAEMAFREALSKADATLQDVLSAVAENNLLPIPPKLRSFIDTPGESLLDFADLDVDFNLDLGVTEILEPSDDERGVDETDAWAAALETPFRQIQGYRDYISEDSIYRTHQGVKGNEFERVMVIMDDAEAGGFMFSYEQYFGAKKRSPNTVAKSQAGEETGLDRTRRLFYVTSTRAKSSLAHVIYTANIEKVRQDLKNRNFAKTEEILAWAEGNWDVQPPEKR